MRRSDTSCAVPASGCRVRKPQETFIETGAPHRPKAEIDQRLLPTQQGLSKVGVDIVNGNSHEPPPFHRASYWVFYQVYYTFLLGELSPPTHKRRGENQQIKFGSDGYAREHTRTRAHAGMRPTWGCRRWLTSCSASRRSSPQSTVTLVVPSPTSSSWSYIVKKERQKLRHVETHVFLLCSMQKQAEVEREKVENSYRPRKYFIMFYLVYHTVDKSIRDTEETAPSSKPKHAITRAVFERSFSFLPSWRISSRERKDGGHKFTKTSQAVRWVHACAAETVHTGNISILVTHTKETPVVDPLGQRTTAPRTRMADSDQKR